MKITIFKIFACAAILLFSSLFLVSLNEQFEEAPENWAWNVGRDGIFHGQIGGFAVVVLGDTINIPRYLYGIEVPGAHYDEKTEVVTASWAAAKRQLTPEKYSAKRWLWWVSYMLAPCLLLVIVACAAAGIVKEILWVLKNVFITLPLRIVFKWIPAIFRYFSLEALEARLESQAKASQSNEAFWALFVKSWLEEFARIAATYRAAKSWVVAKFTRKPEEAPAAPVEEETKA